MLLQPYRCVSTHLIFFEFNIGLQVNKLLLQGNKGANCRINRKLLSNSFRHFKDTQTGLQAGWMTDNAQNLVFSTLIMGERNVSYKKRFIVANCRLVELQWEIIFRKNLS